MTSARELFYNSLPTELIKELQRANLESLPTRQEQERLKLGQQRLKEQYLPIPWYRKRAQQDGEIFWRYLHDSCILSQIQIVLSFAIDACSLASRKWQYFLMIFGCHPMQSLVELVVKVSVQPVAVLGSLITVT